MHSPVENAIASTGFAVLTVTSIPSSYLYLWVTTEEFVHYLVNNASGSAYPAVNANRFKDAEILIPSEEIICVFNDIVEPMRDKIAHNDKESQTLAETRDALLPRLISGELRVGEIY
jgi:type I restriction enzyme S subunit